VQHLDFSEKTIAVRRSLGVTESLPFDRLIVATGAVPVQPNIEGLNLKGVFQLHTMEESFRLKEYLKESEAASAIIVGAGYIGVEMADALSHLGMRITLIGRSAVVLPSVDPDLGSLIEVKLKERAVEVVNNAEVVGIEANASGLTVTTADGWRSQADLVLLVVGVEPASGLAHDAGLPLGLHGAIRVNARMETEIPGVYAAGDCVETLHRVLQRYTYLPLGTTSHKQGRVAGENAAGGSREFAGSVGTQVVKIFDIAVARTGLRQNEAQNAGINAATTESSCWDHKAYYPGAEQLHLRVTGDRTSGRLLGAQILGQWKSEVAKRIDTFATALFHGMSVDGLNDLDLSYTPPLSSPWDPVQMSAQAWTREHSGESHGICQNEKS
jgi:NADPH-dependent 2,4-dienoyl-CoA reductase/sulfur reductase-like enzyme